MTESNAIAIITPCYNENKGVVSFLERLEVVLAELPQFQFYIVVVDDKSTDQTATLLKQHRCEASNTVYDPICLNFNVGHQMAIYQGLAYASQLPCDRFIVIDSDGEDNPEAIKEMIQLPRTDIIKVVRGRRSESMTFQVLYRLYRILFKFITGKQMNFGNYCMINRQVASMTIAKSFIHFPAFLSRLNVESSTIKWNRDKRIEGKSKMNIQSLFYHAFKSFIEYAEDLLMLFFKTFIIVMVFFLLAIGNVLYQKFIADTAILGWTSVIAVGLLNMAFLAIGFFILGVLLLNITGSRNVAARSVSYSSLLGEGNSNN